ncbi:TIGR02677 family protein [Cohnella sp. REN36]|uniref:TIGR02677 family protein n=1 Tax=Cohnella sp. REN36 TaxID=2887347 RepID=UPI001D140159|nr:TIGR02677 family protein [Cohnella sp. REN36]MCC3377588.1 TIGR02677 family protein [Cohnella sp. REN36]
MNSRSIGASLRSVPELSYLNADNVARYRAVMRFMYQEYQRLRYWLRPEDVHAGVAAWDVLDGYTLEQCQQDLERLKEWGNLASRHDGGRALTLEEYMRKKSQYLLTPYAIEIERMLETLEKIKGYGGSLETTYFDTIAECLQQIRLNVDRFEPGEALACWDRLQHAFKTMHENAADFIASMHSIQAEEMMATDAFLAMKETLTDYLQHFVKSLQRSAYLIEGRLQQITDSVRELYLEEVMRDELRKPRIEEGHSPEEIAEHQLQSWANLYRWFIGDTREPSELVLLERATKETIAKVVRSAIRLQERRRSGLSRRKDLETLGGWFAQLDDIRDAHRLAAYAFGLFPSRHLQGEDERETDRADRSMWQEPQNLRAIRSRSRRRVEKTGIEPVRRSDEKRQAYREQVARQLEEEAVFLEQLAGQGEIRIGELGVLTAKKRLQLLQWIGRCTASASRSFIAADGTEVRLEQPRKEEPEALLLCEDGELALPNYRLAFIREGTMQYV